MGTVETNMQLARTHSQVRLGTVFTVCFGVLLVSAAVAFVIITRAALTLALIAMIFAVALDQGASALERLGLRPKISRLVMTFALFATLAGVALLLIPPLISQAKQLSAQLPTIVQKAKSSRVLQTIRSNLPTNTLPDQSKSSAPLEGAAKPVAMVAFGAVGIIAKLVTILFLTVFMLLFGGELVQKALAEAVPERRERYGQVIEKIYKSVGGYILGLLSICATNATLTTVFLAMTRMPFFLPLGVLSGLSSMVPYAGPVVVGSSITLLALATGGVWKAVATAIYFVAYGQLEGNILAPFVFKRTVHLNPLLTLVSVLFFAELWGVPGAVLAVPVVASLQVILTELLAIRRAQMHELDGAEPVALPLEASSHRDEESPPAHH